MKPCLLGVLALIASWGVLLSPHAAFADPPKEAELLKRIDQLEKRVAELEKVIKELRPSAKEPATETEKKLVGNWLIVDADKKTAADKSIELWTDMKMNADGTCALVTADGRAQDAKYRVTVTQIAIRGPSPTAPQFEVLLSEVRIASVTETELVLEYKNRDGWWKMHYTRKK